MATPPRRLAGLVGVALALVAPAAGAGEPAPPVAGPPGIEARCASDGDCHGILLCRNGSCTSAPCDTDDDCAAGRMCRRGVCRVRECHADTDCIIARQCRDGLCALPDPMRRRAAIEPSGGELTGSVSIGPAFPAGVVAEIEVALADARTLYAGAGSTSDAGGLGARLGVRLRRGELGPFERDSWVGVAWLSGPAGRGGDALGVALGSGRSMLPRASAAGAAWWGGGIGLTLPHGVRARRVLRLEAGALLLVHGRYRPERDTALLPCFAVRYGLRF